MLNQVRASLAFARLKDGDLSPFALNVIACLTTNSGMFKTLPVDLSTLQALTDAFVKDLANAKDRSRTAIAEKDQSRQVLENALRKTALYVSTVADGSETLVLKGGFFPTSTNRAQSPVATPVVLAVDNTTAGALKARLKSERNPPRAFLGRIREAKGGEYGPVVSFASSRKIIFDGLKRGVDYAFQLCAIGGSNEQSNWCEPIEGMPN